MAPIDEDDDAFLYGDGDAANTTETTNNEAPVSSNEKSGSDKSSEGENKNGDGHNQEESNDEGDEDDEESDSDSDSDIEFIIGSEETKTATAVDPASTGITAVAEAQTASGVVPEAIGEVTIETDKSYSAVTTTEASITRVPGIEIDKVGEFEGKPITSINLQDLKEKPWRQPGADVSEYFNYGFNELTWTMYCAKQDKLRANYNPQKAVMEMMPMMGMPGMPGMPNMPNMPNMPVLPNMPNIPGFPQAPGMQLPTLPGGLSFPMLPSAPQAQPQTQVDNGLPNGPASFDGLPRAPQRTQDLRDKNDRDFERINSNMNNDNGKNNSGNYRDRDNHRQRFRGGRR